MKNPLKQPFCSCFSGFIMWRREWDSNPRPVAGSLVFKTSSLNHSDISPYSAKIIVTQHRIFVNAGIYRLMHDPAAKNAPYPQLKVWIWGALLLSPAEAADTGS